MYTLHFNANAEDIITHSLVDFCISQYVNVQLTQLDVSPPGDLIQRISNGDITQFIATLGYRYTLNVDGQLIGKSLRFIDLVFQNKVPDNAIYLSGPSLICSPEYLTWILYSVTNKMPANIITDGNTLPPPANQELSAIIQLETTFEGELSRKSMNLHFPQNTTTPYQITFASAPGDVTYATRINGIGFQWTYRVPGIEGEDFDFDSVVLVDDTQLTFVAS